ncbi:helix-turn-helix domain-containing protein [Clostridium perfringens]|jgi:transcriptional regulator with XRE-family HTH domain|uniref:helix-turn-helix domain-containing protein n=1 Tax=Clostridium perfringens TaxID=1502 RepID=UPI00240ECD5E|nr:helix-turn-helix transcriptional regulator [Clostridium perfringens]MDK0688177.1 helix-turn-helix transcriptional regulator [Clostridium perfringens]MDM0793965.1 helix-turn-helix transcriptional regulator [Clostridium perfringens]MDM0802627.1 helix-turn-helix transcriptional regulator [Clostridium perfringens]MDM0875711.1 helix-turn-helix transcriptional regulator [Clostridium perfringens]WFD89341.1 helix-turn-helix transcriptional regulator [Clostridium perfringens]
MLNNRLKSLRNEKGVLQKDVAEYLKISTSAYGFYEQGKRIPDVETLNKLSDYYNVSIDYLLGKSNIKESAEDIINDDTLTLALHNDNGIDEELPEEAKKEIEDFIEYVKHKYKKR